MKTIVSRSLLILAFLVISADLCLAQGVRQTMNWIPHHGKATCKADTGHCGPYVVQAFPVLDENGKFNSCLAAFPYNMLRLQKTKGNVATITWNVPTTVSMNGVTYWARFSQNDDHISFLPNYEYDITELLDFGNQVKQDNTYSIKTAAAPTDAALLDHMPVVEIASQQNFSDAVKCLGVDPLITNQAN